MQQRRLRLGDILDDYCPRERRLTNHAVVAMVEDQVHLTRCTTCDAEHEFKAGKVPPRRKKGTAADALYKEVLAGITPGAEGTLPGTDAMTARDNGSEAEALSAPADQTAAGSDATGEERQEVPEGPVHRPLIRAVLPRPEGQVPERRLPEFTIRQGPNGNFRQDPRGGQGGRPPRPEARGARFGAGRPGPPRGSFGRPGGDPNRSPRPARDGQQPSRHRNKKRSR